MDKTPEQEEDTTNTAESLSGVAGQAHDAWHTSIDDPFDSELKSWRDTGPPWKETEYACMLRRRSADILAGTLTNSHKDEQTETASTRKRWSMAKLRADSSPEEEREESDYWDITALQCALVQAVTRQMSRDKGKTRPPMEPSHPVQFPGGDMGDQPEVPQAKFLGHLSDARGTPTRERELVIHAAVV